MAERKAVTRQVLKRYRQAPKALKGQILDELCALTGWHRDHARKALRQADSPPTARKQSRRPRTYGSDVLVPLRRIWAVLDAPAGKRLAPFLPEIIEALERAGELDLDQKVRAKLLRISAAIAQSANDSLDEFEMLDALLIEFAIAVHGREGYTGWGSQNQFPCFSE